MGTAAAAEATLIIADLDFLFYINGINFWHMYTGGAILSTSNFLIISLLYFKKYSELSNPILFINILISKSFTYSTIFS